MNRFFIPALSLLAACSSNTGSQAQNTAAGNQTVATANASSGTANMRTGFYFLAEKGKGIAMHKEQSDEIFTLSPVPFASVDNISSTKMEKSHLRDGDYTELCVTFDKKGTADLAAGTGNPLQPRIAVVIAGKLLYVVENRTSIRTGIMCVGLVGYSEQQMQDMRDAVDHKK